MSWRRLAARVGLRPHRVVECSTHLPWLHDPDSAWPAPLREARAAAAARGRRLVGRVTLATVIGAAAVYVTGRGVGAWLSLSPFYALKAAAVFVAIMLVAVIGLRAHHPFDRFGPANRITAFRAALTALVAGALGEAASVPLAWTAGLTALAITLMDGLDGRAARRSGLASPFGARFDMEIDALLILVLAALVAQFGKAGAWVIASGLLRYAFVAAGVVFGWMRRPLPPARRRQTVCVLQLAGLMLAVAPFVPRPLSAWLAALSLAVLAWSFAVDVAWLWARRAGGGARLPLTAEASRVRGPRDGRQSGR